MNDLILKAQVVMKAAATWLTATVVLLTTIAPELPETWQTWALRIAAWLGGAITFIRRHHPVVPSARGILPVVHKR